MGTVKDGVVKRGNTWSFVIRVTNHTTGASRPRWVGGFHSEGEAKAARDRARVAARRGEYVDQEQDCSQDVPRGVACRTCSDGETQDVESGTATICVST